MVTLSPTWTGTAVLLSVNTVEELVASKCTLLGEGDNRTPSRA